MVKTRSKMPVSQRAKQFMPFAALKGLDEAIANKEKELEATEKIMLSDYQKQKINDVLVELKKNDEITVTFFNSGFYETMMCSVRKIDILNHYLYTNENRIRFSDIYEIFIEK